MPILVQTHILLKLDYTFSLSWKNVFCFVFDAILRCVGFERSSVKGGDFVYPSIDAILTKNEKFKEEQVQNEYIKFSISMHLEPSNSHPHLDIESVICMEELIYLLRSSRTCIFYRHIYYSSI